MLYKVVSYRDFEREFYETGRASQFPHMLYELYDYLNDIADENMPIELDVIALCCNYSELTYAEAFEHYNVDDVKDIYEVIVDDSDNQRILVHL